MVPIVDYRQPHRRIPQHTLRLEHLPRADTLTPPGLHESAPLVELHHPMSRRVRHIHKPISADYDPERLDKSITPLAAHVPASLVFALLIEDLHATQIAIGHIQPIARSVERQIARMDQSPRSRVPPSETVQIAQLGIKNKDAPLTRIENEHVSGGVAAQCPRLDDRKFFQ